MPTLNHLVLGVAEADVVGVDDGVGEVGVGGEVGTL